MSEADESSSYSPRFGADELPGALLRALQRPLEARFTWSAFRTLGLGLLSFGIAPIIFWNLRWRQYVRLERQQLWHLAEWLRLETGISLAQPLQALAQRLRWRAGIALWSVAITVIVAVTLAAYMVMHQASLRGLLDVTYGLMFNSDPGSRPLRHFALWSAGLSLAYALHWFHVQMHAKDIRLFCDQLNQVLTILDLPPIPIQAVGKGFRPLWMICTIFLLPLGAVWSIPMMLGGAVQKWYIDHVSAMIRYESAERVRMILMHRRPAAPVPTFARPTRDCQAERCRAPIPLGARYCPRCGSPTASFFSEVA